MNTIDLDNNNTARAEAAQWLALSQESNDPATQLLHATRAAAAAQLAAAYESRTQALQHYLDGCPNARHSDAIHAAAVLSEIRERLGLNATMADK